MRWRERHVERLVRDALAAGLGAVDPAAVAERLDALARRHFPDADGGVRLELGPGGEWRGSARPLGAPRSRWTALSARTRHPGPGPAPGAKLAGAPALERARAERDAAGADEALLFDADGRLVEGTRAALVAVLADGRVVTPPSERGGVASIALAIAREQIPAIEPADVRAEDLVSARELVALNALRGARPVAWLDGRALGGGRAGPWAARLDDALAAEEPL